MIHYVKGVYEDSGKDYIIVDNNGLGLKIFVSPSTISRLDSIGRQIKLYTYFHVREDIMSLYGFITKEELDMFELLISVSGIGPKAGLSILSVLSPVKLGLSIMGGDINSLVAVPGVGSKTAKRIILELKDKIDKNDVMELVDDFTEPSADSAKEAVHALISLGYSSLEASSAISKLTSIEGKDTEEIIKAALKNLMK